MADSLWTSFIANNAGNQVLVCSSSDGVNWSNNLDINQSSKFAPSLAVLNNRLIVAFIANNSSNEVLVCSTADGVTWTNNTAINQSSKCAPSLAAFNGKLSVAFIANNSGNQVLVCSSSDGVNWSNNLDINQSSKFAPSLAVFNNRLFVAFIANNSSNEVLVCSTTDGVTWTNNTAISQSSKCAPSLAAFNGKLFVAFIANNASSEVLVCSTADGTFWTNNTPINQASNFAPSLAAFNSRLMVSFISTIAGNEVLICSSADGINWTSNTPINQASQFAPSLAVSPFAAPPTLVRVPMFQQLGTQVTITGTGFGKGTTVTFGTGSPAAPQSISSDGTSLVVTVPTAATSGPATITLPDKSTVEGPSFAVDNYRNTRGFSWVNSDAFQALVGGSYSLEDATALYGASQTTFTVLGNTIEDPLVALFLSIVDSQLDSKGQCFGFSLGSLRFTSGETTLSGLPLQPGNPDPGGPPGPDVWMLDGPPLGVSPLSFNQFVSPHYPPPFTTQEGSGFLEMSTSLPGGSVAQDVAIAPQPGQSYSFSVWLRAALDGSPVSGSVVLWGLGGKQENGSTSFTVGQDWTLVTAPLDVQNSGHTSMRAEIYMTTTGANLDADGALLINAGLQNASFESSSAGWRASNLAGHVNLKQYNPGAGPGYAHDGSGYLEMNTNQPGGSVAQDISISPQRGQSYSFSVWLHAAPNESAISGSVVLWGLGGTQESSSTSFTVGQEWTLVTAPLDVQNSGNTSMRAEIYMTTTGANLDADGAQLINAGLQNASFESSANGWRANNLATSVNLAQYSSSHYPAPFTAHDGSGFLEMNTSTPEGSVAQDVAIAAQAGQSYSFSVWLRAAPNQNPVSGSVALWGLGGTPESGSTSFTVGQDWTLVTAPLDVQNSGHTSLRAEIYMTTTRANLDADGARLISAGLQNASFQTSANGWRGSNLAAPVNVSPTLASFVHRLQMAQYCQQNINQWIGFHANVNSAAGLKNAILQAFSAGGQNGIGAVLALESKSGSGHAVVAYEIVDVVDAIGDNFDILVYNPNVPFVPDEDSSSAIRTTNASQSVIHVIFDGSWTATLNTGGDPNYAGSVFDITVIPWNTIPVQPTVPWAEILGGLALVWFVVGDASVSQVSDGQGHTLLADGKWNVNPATTLPGVRLMPALGGLGETSAPAFVSNRLKELTHSVTGQRTGTYGFSWIGAGCGMTLSGLAATSGEIDTVLTNQGTISLVPASEKAVTATFIGRASAAGSLPRTAALVTTASAGAAVALSYDPASDTFSYGHAGAPIGYTVAFSSYDAQGKSVTYKTPVLTVRTGDTHTFAPDWADLASGAGTVTMRHSDGTSTIEPLKPEPLKPSL